MISQVRWMELFGDIQLTNDVIRIRFDLQDDEEMWKFMIGHSERQMIGFFRHRHWYVCVILLRQISTRIIESNRSIVVSSRSRQWKIYRWVCRAMRTIRIECLSSDTLMNLSARSTIEVNIIHNEYQDKKRGCLFLRIAHRWFVTHWCTRLFSSRIVFVVLLLLLRIYSSLWQNKVHTYSEDIDKYAMSTTATGATHRPPYYTAAPSQNDRLFQDDQIQRFDADTIKTRYGENWKSLASNVREVTQPDGSIIKGNSSFVQCRFWMFFSLLEYIIEDPTMLEQMQGSSRNMDSTSSATASDEEHQLPAPSRKKFAEIKAKFEQKHPTQVMASPSTSSATGSQATTASSTRPSFHKPSDDLYAKHRRGSNESIPVNRMASDNESIVSSQTSNRYHRSQSIGTEKSKGSSFRRLNSADEADEEVSRIHRQGEDIDPFLLPVSNPFLWFFRRRIPSAQSRLESDFFDERNAAAESCSIRSGRWRWKSLGDRRRAKLDPNVWCASSRSDSTGWQHSERIRHRWSSAAVEISFSIIAARIADSIGCVRSAIFEQPWCSSASATRSSSATASVSSRTISARDVTCKYSTDSRSWTTTSLWVHDQCRSTSAVSDHQRRGIQWKTNHRLRDSRTDPCNSYAARTHVGCTCCFTAAKPSTIHSA